MIPLLIFFIVKILLAMLLAFAVISIDTVFSYRLGFAFTALYVYGKIKMHRKGFD